MRTGILATDGDLRTAVRWLAVVILLSWAGLAGAQQQTVGLFLNDERAFAGYTLFAPTGSRTSYLIDIEGKLVKSWLSGYRPGLAVYLLEEGNLLRTAQFEGPGAWRFNSGGRGGRVEEYSWDGDLLWAYNYSTAEHRQHHDIERLPNGNVLLIAWELKTGAEAIAAGRSPALLVTDELWPDQIIELQPFGAEGGNIVWEWHVWDHLIQDYDVTKPNHGVVADHPELIDLNFTLNSNPDWQHTNGIDYNPTLDQIVVSVRNFSEVWVIDHSTTTAQAAGHSGGNSGKGGDLLYRWGNPQAYGRGLVEDRQLFLQHDSRWIESGKPGAGNITVFNNGTGRPGGNHSTVDEFVPPGDEFGDYELNPGAAYGPTAALWTYRADPPNSFFASSTSGAERLPNGNTLICHGPGGIFFEVTPTLETVWRYVNPIRLGVPATQGEPAVNNGAFRATRYAPDFPGFEGKELTPGDPLELYTRPVPVPDGTRSPQPMTATRISGPGNSIQVTWDVTRCPAEQYNLIFGGMADLSTLTIQGAECGIGVDGEYDWTPLPDGNLFFLLVGVDGSGVYESSWGTNGSGAERNGSSPSNLCGVTTKDVTETCP